MSDTVLCVDMDGTLIYNDTLRQALWRFIQWYPWRLGWVLFWLSRGRAYLKQQLAQRVHLNIASLPYNRTFINWLIVEKNRGRKIILATAMDKKVATAVASHIGIFDAVLASDGKTNLRAQAKAQLLNRYYGRKKYIYAANARDDLAVWRHARYAIVVNANVRVLKRAQRIADIIKVF